MQPKSRQHTDSSAHQDKDIQDIPAGLNTSRQRAVNEQHLYGLPKDTVPEWDRMRWVWVWAWIGRSWDAVALNVPAPSPPATFRSHAHKCFISHFYAFFPVRVFPSYGSFFPFAFSGLKVEWQTNLEMRTLAICFVGR